MKNKRGQAALEFFMTYGWMLFVLLIIAIAAILLVPYILWIIALVYMIGFNMSPPKWMLWTLFILSLIALVVGIAITLTGLLYSKKPNNLSNKSTKSKGKHKEFMESKWGFVTSFEYIFLMIVLIYLLFFNQVISYRLLGIITLISTIIVWILGSIFHKPKQDKSLEPYFNTKNPKNKK